MEFTKRKRNRLAEYDYSQPGYYFITICTRNKEKLFWADEMGSQLSGLGKAVEQCILSVEQYYPGTKVDKYVIMPNHVHIILVIPERTDGVHLPGLPVMIGQLKRGASRMTGVSLWQKTFYDHVIRDEQDYQRIWDYVEYNPIRWCDDELYTV